MNNPFNVMYGMIPSSLVSRNDAFDKIVSTFSNVNTNAGSFIITGIKGSGKTVLLRSVAKEFKSRNDWVVIDLNTQGDFVSSFAERLYEEAIKNKLLINFSIDLSLPYITFHFSKNKSSLSAESAIPHLLDSFKKKNKRVLILIDEVNSTNKLKYFANLYQTLIGNGYSLFLLMTGLFENVNSLISSKAASFLARSPKIVLNALDLSSISLMYQKELKASKNEANELAKLSKGYAFAYQVIGNICFEYKQTKIDDKLLDDIDNYLALNGYNVIWKGMSEKEKQICLALSKSSDGSTFEVMKKANMNLSNFNNYRLKMIYKGYLISLGYGKIDFALPRFKEFVLRIEPFM